MGHSTSILCLGDSLTHGSNSTNPAYPYSTEFPQYLREVEVRNEGYSGMGSLDLQKKLVLSLKQQPEDYVILMAGTNDVLMTPAAEILEILEATWAIALDRGSRVVALTILEGQLSDAFHANQMELNRLIKRAVARKNNPRLTYYDAASALPSQEARPDLWGDPIHPNPRGYRILGKGVALYMARLLESTKGVKQSLFRPCIDIHGGQVKQIVGGTLSEDTTQSAALRTNFISEKPASFYADLYKQHDLRGAHVIMLGPNCTEAAKSALAAWPGSLQIGGGINDTNAMQWLEAGAEKVIVTSWLFPNGELDRARLTRLRELVGRDRLVVDLSCRRNKNRSGWTVAMNKWQTLTNLEVTDQELDHLKNDCCEFLVHAADVEGLQNGVDEALVEFLGAWAANQSPPFRITYAGGARSVGDLARVSELSRGYVDLTIGSALDIFGGSGATLQDCIRWNREAQRQ